MRRKEDIVSALFSMLIGIMLIVLRNQVVSIAMTVFGAIVLVSAVMDLINKQFNMAIVKAVLGICIIAFGWVFDNVALYLLAAVIIVLGLLRIVNMHKFFTETTTGKQKLFAYLRPIVTVIAGACLMFSQGGLVVWVVIATGVLLVAEGLLDVASALQKD